jgi:hypothetical protein
MQSVRRKKSEHALRPVFMRLSAILTSGLFDLPLAKTVSVCYNS